MRKLTTVALASGLALTSACHRSPRVAAPAPAPLPSTAPAPAPTSALPGGRDPRDAVERFLTAARNQDLQALADVWGTSTGSVRSGDAMDRPDMEKRELIMMCYLNHDSHQLLGDAPGTGGQRVIVVELHQGTVTRTSNFNVVAGPASRWYVQSFDMQPLQDFCKKR